MECYLKNEKINEELMNMSEYESYKKQHRRFFGRDHNFWVSMIEEIKELVGDTPNIKILDVGCGNGSLVLEMS